MASGDLTDAGWGLVGPLLAARRGRPGCEDRRHLDGILWRAREGAGWRAIPERHGRWNTVWRRFARWRGLGVFEAVRCVASYFWARVRPPADQSTFEGWVAARFGYRLYRIFFKTYTEKVWGVPATEIKADWAAQRIKNL